MNKSDALTGALVADAAAMGLHWLYDQEQIARVEKTGSVLFRAPDENTYTGVKGYFAHAGRLAGMVSHYGESLIVVDRVCRAGNYDVAAHRDEFFRAFGPCGSFNGYADRPTKALVGKIITQADNITDPSGLDDDQMPGLCPVAALFANDYDRQALHSAVGVISTHLHVQQSADMLFTCLELIANGADLKSALMQSAERGTGPICDLINEARELTVYDPLRAAQHFGLACHVPQGMPLVWHILEHALNFEMAVSDNIRCGGDSCGRAMILGAIAGLAFGVPEQLSRRLSV